MKKNHIIIAVALWMLSGSVFPSTPIWNSVNHNNPFILNNDKSVLIYFHADWCLWCSEMERNVLQKPEIEDYISEYFVPVSINIDNKRKFLFNGEYVTARNLADKLNVDTFPTMVFLNSSLLPLGELSGYYEEDELMKVLRYVGQLD